MNILLSFLSTFIILFPSPVKKDVHKMTLNYVEYNRGMSFPTRAWIRINYPGYFDLTFHDVYMKGYSFYPDDSILPNAFLSPLLQGKIGDAIGAFTEPYYGIRFYHFFKKKPNFGIGFEFVHLKVFIPDEDQQVYTTGVDENGPVDEWKSAHEYISSFNVSHGVNHLSLSLVYRIMLFPTEKILAGKLQPYFAVSAGTCIPHPQLRLVGSAESKAFSYQADFSNFNFGANLGARFQFSKHFGMYFEYKYTQSYLRGMRFDNGEEGTIQMRFPAHHLAWGLSYIF
ncbi:MAG TPA: hypothetical protein ENI18_14280 [Candidatus Aminicenantes bacterium]|nr:hypothetical protein [Candidatus Aminicenantes bacterium]